MVQFYPWFQFYFPLFWGMVMYDKVMIMRLKQRKMKSKPRKNIEPQHNKLNNKALRWNISQYIWSLFLFVCYCLLFSQRVPQCIGTTCVINSFFSVLDILWSYAEVKVSELKVSWLRRNLVQYRKLNRFLQRSRKAMAVNIYLAIQ